MSLDAKGYFRLRFHMSHSLLMRRTKPAVKFPIKSINYPKFAKCAMIRGNALFCLLIWRRWRNCWGMKRIRSSAFAVILKYRAVDRPLNPDSGWAGEDFTLVNNYYFVMKICFKPRQEKREKCMKYAWQQSADCIITVIGVTLSYRAIHLHPQRWSAAYGY